uniref:Uncharacterized protein n=1 Tax=viral metagenome TaxID=1070528 RepID=A0A6M3MAX9_9ZZZZ
MITLDVCDHPLFMRLAKERIQPFSRTYYEMDNGLYTLDIKEAKEFTEGGYKHFKILSVTLYRVGDSEFLDYERAIEYSMVMLILTYGFRKFKIAKDGVKE